MPSAIITEVRGYGGHDSESFDDYYARWPSELRDFPKDLVEQWIHRHWTQFESNWLSAGVLNWSYNLESFTNDQILEISHIGDWMETIDQWGKALFTQLFRRQTWLGDFMLENGTVPVPILVLIDSKDTQHPRGLRGEKMVQPYQLIEGHMRLAYLRGMIAAKHPTLKTEHEVWVARN